jgi:hypothetical protein
MITNVRQFKMKKQIIIDPSIEDIKNKLPKRGSFGTISKMINGKYTSQTIRHMFAQRRTMSPIVLDAAKKLIDFISPETKPEENENSK